MKHAPRLQPAGPLPVQPLGALATGNGSKYTVATLVLPPYHPGTPLHRHPGYTEGCYVVEGTLAITCDGATITLSRGESLLIAAGVMHASWNPTATQTTVLLVYEPGCDTEQIMALAGAAASPLVIYEEAV